MPTCAACDQKLEKARFSKDQLKLGAERVCKNCQELTSSLFKTALSTRRFDEVSADAEVERLRAVDANTQADAANRLWTLTRRGDEKASHAARRPRGSTAALHRPFRPPPSLRARAGHHAPREGTRATRHASPALPRD